LILGETGEVFLEESVVDHPFILIGRSGRTAVVSEFHRFAIGSIRNDDANRLDIGDFESAKNIVGGWGDVSDREGRLGKRIGLDGFAMETRCGE
jgi:hypothetical protein